ncbi:MAG: hypothetical protein ACFFAJ_17630 [Candidatus Hodarchaeota archaeon]
MIIKNLWIISSVGICYYHYRAPFSDYQIDSVLFSGLVAGLSNFAESLSVEHKSLDYLKMGGDELHLESLGDIIVATILAGGGNEALDSFSTKLMLQFIGQKFLEEYQGLMNNLAYNWEDIQEPFNKEIKAFIQDQALLEDIKRGQFQNLFNQVISGILPADLLHWKGVQLFADSSEEGLEESLKVISGLEDVTPNLIEDALLEAKVLDVIHKLLKDLRSKIAQQEPKKLLVLCNSKKSYERLYQIFLPRKLFPIHCPTFTSLQKIIETWKDPSSYDILVIDTELTKRELRSLYSMPMDDLTKIVMVVNKIPRPPRGRIVHKRPISFVVQDEVEIIRNNPLVDYLLNFFVS